MSIFVFIDGTVDRQEIRDKSWDIRQTAVGQIRIHNTRTSTVSSKYGPHALGSTDWAKRIKSVLLKWSLVTKQKVQTFYYWLLTWQQ